MVPVVILYKFHEALLLAVQLAVGADFEFLGSDTGLKLGALRSALAFLNVVKEIKPFRGVNLFSWALKGRQFLPRK